LYFPCPTRDALRLRIARSSQARAVFVFVPICALWLAQASKFNRESEKAKYFNLRRLRSVARQCLQGLAFIHDLNLIHCDLKVGAAAVPLSSPGLPPLSPALWVLPLLGALSRSLCRRAADAVAVLSAAHVLPSRSPPLAINSSCIALHCTALHCIALHRVGSRCVALRCVAREYFDQVVLALRGQDHRLW
jgi:hypothetical protein